MGKGRPTIVLQRAQQRINIQNVSACFAAVFNNIDPKECGCISLNVCLRCAVGDNRVGEGNSAAVGGRNPIATAP